jgi:hypothetical protein
MNEYQVSWTIDIEAESMDQAARQARAIQLDPDSIATVFTVSHRNAPDKVAEVDVVPHTKVYFQDEQEQEAYEDLLSKVHSNWHSMTLAIDKKLLTLAKSGPGVLPAQISNHEDKPYLEARKVVLALLRDFEREQQPPNFLNTKAFKAEVSNYYALI